MKCVVVGCGSIGRRHMANLMSLGVGDVMACDSCEDACARVKQEFGVLTVSTLDAALAASPDAVVVCTPPSSHIAVAERALAAGAHLFIEKPLAASPVALNGFVERARASRQVVLCAANMRFHPGVARLGAAVRDGLVGRPWLARAHFSHYLPHWCPERDYRDGYAAHRDEGGGIILDAIHEIDYVLWLLGDDDVGEGAVGQGHGGKADLAGVFGGHVSALLTDAEDTALLMFRFPRGALAEIHLDCLRPVKSRGCEIVGSAGSIRWISEGKRPERLRVDWCPLTETTWRPLARVDSYDGNDMYVAEMRHFLACTRGDEAPIVGPVQAARVLSVADACRRLLDAQPVSG